jgi:hypothetical protein
MICFLNRIENCEPIVIPIRLHDNVSDVGLQFMSLLNLDRESFHYHVSWLREAGDVIRISPETAVETLHNGLLIFTEAEEATELRIVVRTNQGRTDELRIRSDLRVKEIASLYNVLTNSHVDLFDDVILAARNQILPPDATMKDCEIADGTLLLFSSSRIPVDIFLGHVTGSFPMRKTYLRRDEIGVIRKDLTCEDAQLVFFEIGPDDSTTPLSETTRFDLLGENVRILVQIHPGTVPLSSPNNTTKNVSLTRPCHDSHPTRRSIVTVCNSPEQELWAISRLNSLRKAQYPSVMRLLESTISRNDSGCTVTMVTEGETFKISPETKINTHLILCGLAKAFVHLHSKNVVFRTLCLSNVELNCRGEPVLCDFLYAVDLSEDAKPFPINDATVKQYCAPELSRNNRIEETVDAWSFGLLVYELVFHKKVTRQVIEDLHQGIHTILN